EPAETTDDFEQINAERVGIVRALSKTFGPRFIGGLIPTNYAKSRYPDAVSTHASDRKSYVALAKRCLIGIYTRGLHNSIAFKMAEYLASSKCIVSCPLVHELLAPLTSDNCLYFTTPNECVRYCESLLNDPDAVAAMRQGNFRYYRDHVEPAQH